MIEIIWNYTRQYKQGKARTAKPLYKHFYYCLRLNAENNLTTNMNGGIDIVAILKKFMPD
jgi:hypothetical protein